MELAVNPVGHAAAFPKIETEQSFVPLKFENLRWRLVSNSMEKTIVWAREDPGARGWGSDFLIRFMDKGGRSGSPTGLVCEVGVEIAKKGFLRCELKNTSRRHKPTASTSPHDPLEGF